MYRRLIKKLIKIIGVILAGTFILLSFQYFHAENFLMEMKGFFLGNPFILIIVTISYLLSFVLRAEAWRLYLGKSVRFFSCLQGVLLSLFINHITPIKVGDAVRIGVLSWSEKNIKPEVSAHSVVVLRVMDMFFLLLFSAIGLIVFSKTFTLNVSLGILFSFILIGLIGTIFILKYRPVFAKKHIQLLRTSLAGKNAVFIILLVALSWAIEGAVVWGVTTSMGQGLLIYKAIWINSLTVGGQVFQITPGGISTYESVMTAALTTFDFSVKDGYMAALVSHSYKFIFSYFAGFLLLLHSPVSKVKQIREILFMRGKQE